MRSASVRPPSEGCTMGRRVENMLMFLVALEHSLTTEVMSVPSTSITLRTLTGPSFGILAMYVVLFYELKAVMSPSATIGWLERMTLAAGSYHRRTVRALSSHTDPRRAMSWTLSSTTSFHEPAASTWRR